MQRLVCVCVCVKARGKCISQTVASILPVALCGQLPLQFPASKQAAASQQPEQEMSSARASAADSGTGLFQLASVGATDDCLETEVSVCSSDWLKSLPLATVGCHWA